jgi:hypothetical protein
MTDLWLRIPFALNILILAPVCWAMFSNRGAHLIFQGAVASSPGLERLIGSVWLAILMASVIGLAAPRLLAPLLCIQIFYKLVWLSTHVAPGLNRQQPHPTGIALTFLFIVLTWPVFLWLAYV